MKLSGSDVENYNSWYVSIVSVISTLYIHFYGSSRAMHSGSVARTLEKRDVELLFSLPVSGQ